MSLNASQQKIADTTDGLLVVDAGPGTGKTHTIVERYVNIIKKPDVTPANVLLLTFTNNAATEMEERIKNRLTEIKKDENESKAIRNKMDTKLVMTKTFDAFCMSIVMDSPELVSRFFKIPYTLTRGAKLSDNDTINDDYFCGFLDRLLDEHGKEYGDWSVIAGENPLDLLNLINKLMAKGIVPMKNGWLAMDEHTELLGDEDALLGRMRELNRTGSKGGAGKVAKAVMSMDPNNVFEPPAVLEGLLSESALEEAARGDRTELLDFIHFVYYEYIASSIMDNRLTFGLVAIFAFVLLFKNKKIRERNSYRYVMIDEFQDTNANQMMIAMMTLEEPNLCVVGDWKQGIYGFRFVSIENIIEFESRLVRFRRYLNDDEERVRFRVEETMSLPLDVNYRSSQRIIDKAYEVLKVEGSQEETIDHARLDRDIVLISADKKELDEVSEIRYVQTKEKAQEVEEVVRAIRDYMTPGRYTVRTDKGDRPVEYGDIAVICRNTEPCRAVMKACTDAGIPAFLHGDMKVMCTREGKLALAWLRIINNERDLRGVVPILSDLGYSLSEINAVKSGGPLPVAISDFRRELRNKRRRITELLTAIFKFYCLDNDITQSIITTVSTAHRNSLLTISDVIRIISEDIENETTYHVENSIDDASVSIMTMHKSKGLEFPIVITPLIDSGVMPSTRGDSDVFLYSNSLGIRCTKEVGRFDGYSKIVDNWRTRVAKATVPTDYSEERRLMFVTLSRAKQYETLICCEKPSRFIESLSGKSYSRIPDSPDFETEAKTHTIPKPDISGYTPKVRRMGVHDIMDFGEDGTSNMNDRSDEPKGKGKEYGTDVHHMAYYICRGHDVDLELYPELPAIKDIVDGLKDAELRPEVDCGLPVPDTGVTLRGTIDLLADFGDRIEIHDWKTDVSRDFEDEYKLQLSVYAHAAGSFYGKPVSCIIDYVSRGETVEFEPLPMKDIQERVIAKISQ